MADTNLYKILSGLYTGLNKLNTKSDRRDDKIITGWLGYGTTAPDGTTVKTVDARLDALEAGTSAASGVLTIAGKTYAPLSSVEVLSSDIIANVSAALATGATGLAVAGDVYANDMFLSGKIDDIASSYLTGVQADNDALNGLTLGTNDHKVTGAVLIDGITIEKSDNRLKTAISLSAISQESDSTYAAVYALVDKNGNKLGSDINIPKDQFLKDASYLSGTEQLHLEFWGPSGNVRTVDIDVKDMVHEYKGSDAIDVANNVDGKSAISLKLAPSSTNDNKYLNITTDGLGLSGITEAIAAVSTDATAGLETLSGALSGYLSGNAVSNKFADIDTHLTAIDTKLGTDVGNSASSGQVFVADASGNLDASGKTIGGATLDTTPSADKLATEAAVKAALDGLNDNLKGAYADNKVVLGNGGTGLKASAYEIGDDVALEAKPTADKLATEKALWAQYNKTVNDDLANLANNVATLANSI